MSHNDGFELDEKGYITVGLCKFRKTPDFRKPAMIWLNEDNTVQSEEWHAPAPHRVNGPAKIVYNSKGNRIEEVWYSMGRIHRTDGPAVIMYDDDGKVIYQRFYVYGNRCFWTNLFYGVGWD